RMLTAGNNVRAALEQLCCSTQTGLTIKDRTIELSELTIPPFTANHVFDHLQSLLTLAGGVVAMPGTDRGKVDPLPRQGSSWPVRIALAGGLICLVVLLFLQPYNHPAGTNASTEPSTGVEPIDAARMQQLQGWRVARRDDFSGAARGFMREHQIEVAG